MIILGIILHTDNRGVLFVVNCLLCSSDLAVKLLRFDVLSCFKLNICLKVKYIDMKSIDFADFLSHAQWERFFSLVLHANSTGIPCLDHLWNMIADSIKNSLVSKTWYDDTAAWMRWCFIKCWHQGRAYSCRFGFGSVFSLFFS